jgi:hypothetical protein
MTEMMLTNLEYIELGPSPAGEDCVQVGEQNYSRNARKECERYVSLLEEMFPTDNHNNFFEIMGFPHDFGTYYEVVVYFNPTNTKSVDFAYNVESNLPEYWS